MPVLADWESEVDLVVCDPDYMKVILGRSGESKTLITTGAALLSFGT